MGKNPIRSTTMPNRMMPNTGTSVERMDNMGASEGYCLFNQSESASYIPCAVGMQWKKRRPLPCLGYPGMSTTPFSPSHGHPSLFFLFPVGTLDGTGAAAQKNLLPTTAWTQHDSQETKARRLIKTACSFHGAFCWRCVSRSYPPPPPLPAPIRQNTIKPSGIWRSFKNPRNGSSVSRGKSLPKPS